MSVNARLIAALADTEIPEELIFPDVCLDPSSTYYTFNYDAIPTGYADNRPIAERLLIQVHFFCPHEFDSIRRRLATKQRLFDAGFGWPEEVNATNHTVKDGAEGQHFVFECEALQEVEYGEIHDNGP